MYTKYIPAPLVSIPIGHGVNVTVAGLPEILNPLWLQLSDAVTYRIALKLFVLVSVFTGCTMFWLTLGLSDTPPIPLLGVAGAYCPEVNE
jgi:hypothetical protein